MSDTTMRTGASADDLPKVITYMDKYGPAMEITDQAEADAYFEKCVRHSMSFDLSRDVAENTERSNLGYWAGYYSHETRKRVERLFRCTHPIFGKAEADPPDPDHLLELGKTIGRISRKDGGE